MEFMEFPRMELPRLDFRYHQEQMNASITIIKTVGTRVLDIVLRLPGLFLLELWWRNKDVSFEEISQEMLMKAPFNSYFDISTILDFVHRRDFDQSAALILNNSVLILSALFLTLPLIPLLRLYAHGVSLCIFAFAHHMSSTYIYLESASKEQHIQLDDFVKLERHGFHFLAQLLLSVLQSFVLGLESDFGRACLTMFTAPIVARMCGCPPDKLIQAHNISCSLAMLFMSFYVLYKVPIMVQGLKAAFRELRVIFVDRGLALGVVTVWRRLRLAEQLTFAWLALFFIRVYVEMFEKGRSWREAGPVLLSGIAESTNTPLSLLALALTVGYVCKWIVDGAQLVIGGPRHRGHVLDRAGYVEALTLALLCVQASLIRMDTERKAFLMGLVLFVVVAALLHSLYELLEPQLLSLAACPSASRGRHLRCLILAVALVILPTVTACSIVAFLPLDLWCVMICCNSVLVTVHATSGIVQYIVGMIETKAPEPWERSDDVLFYVRCTTKFVELLLAMIVVFFMAWFIYKGEWTFLTVVILLFHIIINIYKRIEVLVHIFHSRRLAVRNIDRLPKASSKDLTEKSDVCAICFMDMLEEARITPCNHYFHGACLRKWLAVKQVCPLCYSDMVKVEPAPPPEPEPEPLPPQFRDQRRRDAARDMWPLMNQQDFESDASDSDNESATSTTATEFTVSSVEGETN